MAGNIRLSNAEQSLELAMSSPKKFSFFQLMRLLKHHLSEEKLLEFVDIYPDETLSFPSSDVVEFTKLASGNYVCKTTFFGLYGVSSPLPSYYLEEIMRYEQNEVHSIKRLIDYFHRQFYYLLYKVWEKRRISLTAIELSDPKSISLLQRLSGVSTLVAAEQGTNTTDFYNRLIKYASIWTGNHRTATALKILLEDYFKIEVLVHQFHPSYHAIPEEQHIALGRKNHVLGETSHLGSVILTYNNILVELGPLSMDRYSSFLPTGDAMQELQSLIRCFMQNPITTYINIKVNKTLNMMCLLGDKKNSSIGMNAWLSGEKENTMHQIKYCINYNGDTVRL